MDNSRRKLLLGIIAAAPALLLRDNVARAIGIPAPSSTPRAESMLASLSNGQHDATAAIQAIIDASAAHGVAASIPAGKFLIDPDVGVALHSGSRLVLSPQTQLIAQPSRHGGYAVVRLYGIENASVTGGQIIGERTRHLGKGGEWGMGIDIRGSTNITVSDVSVSDCWGDGFYIGMGPKNHQPCRNITLERVTGTNNRRQGLSIVGCIGAKILNSTFRDTNGTSPQSGIDIEPNGNDPAQQILIRNCTATNNAGAGIQTHNHLSDVTIDGCQMSGNTQAGISLRGATKNVTLQNNTIKNSRGFGIYIGKHAVQHTIKGNIIHTSLLGQRLKIAK